MPSCRRATVQVLIFSCVDKFLQVLIVHHPPTSIVNACSVGLDLCIEIMQHYEKFPGLKSTIRA